MKQRLKTALLLSLCACLLLTSACSSKKVPDPGTDNSGGSSETVDDPSQAGGPLSQPLSEPLSGPVEPAGNGVQAKVDVTSKKFFPHTDHSDGIDTVTLLISGTLTNSEKTPAVCTRLTGTAYNSSNTLIAAGDPGRYAVEIPAGGESKFAFSLPLPAPLTSQDVSTIKVEPVCERSSQDTPSLPSDPNLIQFVSKHIEIDTTLTEGPVAILTGVVQNASTAALEFTAVYGSIYDASGMLLGKQRGTIYPAVLGPGANGFMSLEFEIPDAMKLSEITRQWFDLSYFASNASTRYFTVPESHRTTDDLNTWAVTGTIENPTGDTAPPTVLVLLYNQADQLIDLKLGQTTAPASTTRQVISFSAATLRLLSLIDHYDVIVFSNAR